MEMEWYWALAVLIGLVMFFMVVGVPVAMTFITVNIIGVLIFMGDLAGWTQIVDNSTSLITRFTLGPVPMFIMMGALFFHTGLAIRVFDGLDVLFGRLPGRLCYLTVAGGAMFSTLTGSSMANTAMLGALMVPEMQRRGYSQRMSMGPILGTGGLAMIIPPSALGVLLASVGAGPGFDHQGFDLPDSDPRPRHRLSGRVPQTGPEQRYRTQAPLYGRSRDHPVPQAGRAVEARADRPDFLPDPLLRRGSSGGPAAGSA